MSISPPNDEVLADLIIAKRWHNITYLHDGLDGKHLFAIAVIFEKCRASKSTTHLLVDSVQDTEQARDFRWALHHQQ